MSQKSQSIFLPGKFRYFDNLLFTVACINPHLKSDPGAAELFQAEKTRYLYTMKNADSDAQTTDDFLLKYYDKQIGQGVDNVDYTHHNEVDLATVITRNRAVDYADYENYNAGEETDQK